jgi:hypothetical protein
MKRWGIAGDLLSRYRQSRSGEKRSDNQFNTNVLSRLLYAAHYFLPVLIVTQFLTIMHFANLPFLHYHLNP